MVKNLKDLLERYSDEDKCRELLIQQRWDGVPICPFCGCDRSYKIEKGKRFKCANKECWKKYSVTVGTIYEASNIPLRSWFIAQYLVTSHKKGISSVQLAKHLGITQKSAWFMIHRIREMVREKEPLLLEGDVQGDEAYLGGLEENKHKEKKAHSIEAAGRVKTPVVGLLQTGGSVVLQVMHWVTKKNVADFILGHVRPNSTLVTDGAQFYLRGARKMNHVIIDTKISHKKDGKHKNGIENIWSGLQRCIGGTYHSVSPKHLQRYCDEYSYRFNSRTLHDGFRWLITFQKMEGRLKYVDLIKNDGQSKKRENGTPFYPIETGE